jgi:RecB family exonuclease
MTVIPMRTMNGFKPLADLEVLRVTGIRSFERCAYTWALQFLTGEGERRSSPSANIGTAVHSILESVVRVMRGGPEVDTTASWMRVPEPEQANLIAYIEAMMAWRVDEVLACEHEFTAEIEGVGKPVRGHMDLVLRMADGSLAIVDHKTNRAYDDVDYWRADMQPLLYAWAARREWGPAPVRFRIGYVNMPGVFVDWLTDPAEDQHVEERMRDNWARMAAYDRAGVWPMSVNDQCKWCDIATVCPEHQNAIERFKLQLESTFSTATTGDKLAFVNAVMKAAQTKKEELEAMLRAEIAAAPMGRVVHGNSEYSLTVPTRRKLDARKAVSTLAAWMKEAPRESVDAAIEALPDLFTAKVTGVDALEKTVPTLAHELNKHVRIEEEPARIKSRSLMPSERSVKAIGGKEG